MRHRKTVGRQRHSRASALLLSVLLAVGFMYTGRITVLAAGIGPQTSWHYTANGNFSGSTFVPGSYGFNLADVSTYSDLANLPSGVKALVWVGMCNGADSAFTTLVQQYVNDSRVYGYYLMDEPDPTGKYFPQCLASNMKAESDWIHTHDPGKKTFMILMDMGSATNPDYTNTYKPSNSDVDLYGMDPYPCRSELSGCDYSYITKAFNAASTWGVPVADMVPVYQTFGGGAWVDDGSGSYLLPTTAQEQQILTTWAGLVPSPQFDYAYSWGDQNGDQALADSSSLQQLFETHNTPSSSGSSPAGNGGVSAGQSNNSPSQTPPASAAHTNVAKVPPQASSSPAHGSTQGVSAGGATAASDGTTGLKKLSGRQSGWMILLIIPLVALASGAVIWFRRRARLRR